MSSEWLACAGPPLKKSFSGYVAAGFSTPARRDGLKPDVLVMMSRSEPRSNSGVVLPQLTRRFKYEHPWLQGVDDDVSMAPMSAGLVGSVAA